MLASMSAASSAAAAAALCIAAPAAWRVFAPARLVSVVFPAASRCPNVRHPRRVVPARVIDHILLVVTQVGHVAGFCNPRPARASVVLDLVAGPDPGAGYRVAPGIPGGHCFNGHTPPH